VIHEISDVLGLKVQTINAGIETDMIENDLVDFNLCLFEASVILIAGACFWRTFPVEKKYKIGVLFRFNLPQSFISG